MLARSKMAVENHILEKYGWREIDRVLNTRTGNTVITWKKELKNV